MNCLSHFSSPRRPPSPPLLSLIMYSHYSLSSPPTQPNELKENTVWVETLSGAFYNYLSKKYAHLGWYLGLKKSGKGKRGHKTEYGQRAVQFLPRHPYPIG